MKIRRRAIQLRTLQAGKGELIETMRKELEERGATRSRWRSRFLASGKITCMLK